MQGPAPSTARNLVPPTCYARGFMIEKTEYMDKQKFPEGADARLGAGMDVTENCPLLHGLVFTLTVSCYITYSIF